MKIIMKIEQTSHWQDWMLEGTSVMPSGFCRKRIFNVPCPTQLNCHPSVSVG